MTRLEVAVIEFDQNGNPRNPTLFDAAQAFCEREFGQKVNFLRHIKTWVVVKISDEGEGYEVVGMTALAQALDCPVFHIKAPTEDEESRNEARKVRDILMLRASSFIQDNAGSGTEVFVFCAPEQERFWKGFLRLIHARVASRWIVKV